jgi:hypothetical protein
MITCRYSITTLMAWITLSIICIIEHHAMSHPVWSQVQYPSGLHTMSHPVQSPVSLGSINWNTMCHARVLYHCAHGLNHPIRYMYHSASLTEPPCPSYVSLSIMQWVTLSWSQVLYPSGLHTMSHPVQSHVSLGFMNWDTMSWSRVLYHWS